MPNLAQVLRTLYRRGASSLLLVALCALGVALSTTIFAVVQAVLLRPLPYLDADRLVKPWAVAEAWGIQSYPFSWDNYRDFRDGVEALDGLAAIRTMPLTLEGDGRPVSVNGARVTENLFAVLGVEPVLGRVFERQPGEAPEEGVAVIGYGLWQRLFAGEETVLGQVVKLDGEPHTVIGVLPRHHRFPNADSQVFVPLRITGPPESDRGFHFLRLVGRLREGYSRESAEAEMKSVARHLAEAYPDASGALGIRLPSLKDETLGASQRSLGTLFAAVQVLFLIAWANIAILLLARGLARHSELQLRAAVGASRRRLIALLVTEASVVAMIGCAFGLGLGALAVGTLERIDPQILPRAYEVAFTPSLVAWALAVSLAGAVVFGGLPGWITVRSAFVPGASSRTTDARTGRINARLVAIQVALALPLLVASGMQLRSVRALAAVDLGFPLAGKLTAGVALPPNRFGVDEQQLYVERAVEALRDIPGVASVGAMSHLPLSTRNASLVAFRPDQAGQSDLPNALYRVISAGLLRTLGIPLLAGREFEPRDDLGDSPVIVVDETLADALYPDRDPLGRRIRLGSDPTEWEIVGVARAAQLVRPDEPPAFTVYVPISRNPFAGALITPKFVLDVAVAPATLATTVRETLQAVDPDQAVLEVRPLVGQVDAWLEGRRAVAWLLWAIAIAALVLATAGIYATSAFAVGRRLREMAIRTALGADGWRLATKIVAEGVKCGLAGTVLGLALCLVVSHQLAVQLFGVGRLDVPSLIGAAGLLVAASLAAAAGPALRAAREDPAGLLRDGDSA